MTPRRPEGPEGPVSLQVFLKQDSTTERTSMFYTSEKDRKKDVNQDFCRYKLSSRGSSPFFRPCPSSLSLSSRSSYGAHLYRIVQNPQKPWDHGTNRSTSRRCLFQCIRKVSGWWLSHSEKYEFVSDGILRNPILMDKIPKNVNQTTKQTIDQLYPLIFPYH